MAFHKVHARKASSRWRALKFLAIVVLLWPAPSSLFAAPCPDADIVKRAADALMAAARAGSPPQFADALRTYADLDSITMFALGKHRKLLPDEQREELVALTTLYVSRTFNNFRLKFKAESIQIEDCRDDLVRSVMKFRGHQGKQIVLWRMKDARVADVNLQNVWMGQLLRTEFYRLLAESNGNFKALLSSLTQ